MTVDPAKAQEMLHRETLSNFKDNLYWGITLKYSSTFILENNKSVPVPNFISVGEEFTYCTWELEHPIEGVGHERYKKKVLEYYGRVIAMFIKLTCADDWVTEHPNPLNSKNGFKHQHKRLEKYMLKDLYEGYCNTAKINKKVIGPKLGGLKRGGQQQNHVQKNTIPKIVRAIKSLIKAGEKPTQKKVEHKTKLSLSTVKRHWHNEKVQAALECWKQP